MTSKNTKTFEFRLGRTALIVFVSGMSCLVFAAFILGVLVGKDIDTYPEKIARGIPGKILGRAGAPAAQRAAPQRPAVSEKDSTVRPSGAPTAGILGSMEPPPAEDRPPTPVGPAGSVVSSQKTDSPVQKRDDSKTMDAKRPAPVTASQETRGKYLLQVASYDKKEKAERTAARIGALGYAPRVIATDLREKGIWFRVQIGGFTTRDEAQRAADHIAAKIGGVRSAVKPSSSEN